MRFPIKSLLSISLCIAAGIGHAAPDDPSMAPRTRVGDKMPAVSVETLNGKTFSLADQRGNIVVVNFWATWCGPCKIEMPRLEKEVWQKHKAAPDFAMIAIAREQDNPTVTNFQTLHKEYTFPLAIDPKRTTYKLFADAGIPRTYVVDRQGTILFQSLGANPADLDELEHAVDKALAAKQR